MTFGPDYRIRSVKLRPEGKELAVERTTTGFAVTVPKLEIHTMVVADLE